MTTTINPNPFLRTTHDFPEDAQALGVELNKTYIDLANAINGRTIAIFPTNRPAQNGEVWYLRQNRSQAGLRQAYNITGTGNIPHGINLTQISGFVRIYGAFTDGTVWYPLPYVDTVAIGNQVSVSVTATNIVITSPVKTVQSGTIVLEWIVNP